MIKRCVIGLVLVAVAQAQSWEEQVVAGVLMGEAANQGSQGMLAVGEVIHRRSRLTGLRPLDVVSRRNLRCYAFSCLNGQGTKSLVERMQREPEYPTALEIARQVCQRPETLPGITRGATHYARKEMVPWWARGRRRVAVIQAHAFYRLPDAL